MTENKMIVYTARCRKKFVIDNNKLNDFKRTRIYGNIEKQINYAVRKFSTIVKSQVKLSVIDRQENEFSDFVKRIHAANQKGDNNAQNV